jgi:hypothetical protein
MLGALVSLRPSFSWISAYGNICLWEYLHPVVLNWAHSRLYIYSYVVVRLLNEEKDTNNSDTSFHPKKSVTPIPVAERSKAYVCRRALSGIVGSNPTGDMKVVSCKVFVLSGRGLCDGPIPRPEESYRLWCVFECDQVKIKKTLYTYREQSSRRGKYYENKGHSVTNCSATQAKARIYLRYILNLRTARWSCPNSLALHY